ncbi:cysteine hydrolase [Peribacillus psychrosaccharolyticus]|uniref:Cysteine hydrolase n=1 Tax=Peribacillus psychrosaccharolyticus TaxID=1407 RepID=A0A974NNW8_PERPY|nr:cysteine hydrolase family protein [Peribacillus psychrosaccharolyticus]MEC2054028.1 cysteine hydrolase family protein [Peribacillus psychrosaccharolyticus]MED3742357.1 cysteine hydrolase family protein [Peribacillus psychrosaccharolyticus]QQT01325.1 cysteine hydrolase [Peribacillus psychrosaccharolyticus]
MSTALIIVDIQNDYFPNGKMELSNPEKAAVNAAKVLEHFRKNNNGNIFHVQHIAGDPSLGFFVPDTEGANIHKTVQPLENESIIIKHFANSFLQTELESKLKEKRITKLVVVGMMTHMCIDATVRAAVDLGYETTLIEDACATREISYQDQVVPAEQVHYAFVSALNGMYANVISTADFLQQT